MPGSFSNKCATLSFQTSADSIKYYRKCGICSVRRFVFSSNWTHSQCAAAVVDSGFHLEELSAWMITILLVLYTKNGCFLKDAIFTCFFFRLPWRASDSLFESFIDSLSNELITRRCTASVSVTGLQSNNSRECPGNVQSLRRLLATALLYLIYWNQQLVCNNQHHVAATSWQLGTILYYQVFSYYSIKFPLSISYASLATWIRCKFHTSVCTVLFPHENLKTISLIKY